MQHVCTHDYVVYISQTEFAQRRSVDEEGRKEARKEERNKERAKDRNTERHEEIILAPYEVQPYDYKDEVTQAKGNNTRAIRRTAIRLQR